MKTWLRALAGAAASAALVGLAGRIESPWHWAALLALVPWLLALERAPLAPAMVSGAFFAMAYAGAVYPWFAATVENYSGAGAAAAWAASIALAPLLMEPQIAVAALFRALGARVSRGFAAWLFVLAWIAAEWAAPKVFPDTLGYALHASERMRQAADVAGVRGLTLACLAVSECLAAAILTRRLRPALIACAIVAALQGYGALRLAQVSQPAPHFTAGVVQANITNYDRMAAEQGTYDTVAQILGTHLQMSQALAAQGADVVVWPETVYPTSFGAPRSEEGAEFDRLIASFPARTGVPLVFGAFEANAGGDHNAAFFVEASGAASAYGKTVLFPLTEYVPPWLDSPALRRALPWAGHWSRGPGPRAVSLRLRDGTQARFAPLICYEALDPGYVAAAARQRATALLTLSNDSWFPDGRAPRLHLLGAAFRSIETRLPMVRATNSGISALVLPSGEVVSAAAFGSRAALLLPVPRVAPPETLALRLGDWLGPFALFLLIASLAAPALSTGRFRRAGSAPRGPARGARRPR